MNLFCRLKYGIIKEQCHFRYGKFQLIIKSELEMVLIRKHKKYYPERYILSDNFALIQDDPILSVNEKEQRILELPYYTPVESGRDLVKNLTYNYVE